MEDSVFMQDPCSLAMHGDRTGGFQSLTAHRVEGLLAYTHLVRLVQVRFYGSLAYEAK